MKSFREWKEEDLSIEDKIISGLPKGTHYIVKCNCGSVLCQCRCDSPKRITIIIPNSCDKCK